MVQQEVVRTEDHDNILLIHDEISFMELCNDCISILIKAKNIEQTKMHIFDVIAKTNNEYTVKITVKVTATLSETERLLSGTMFISYDDLIEIVGLDADNCLDLVNLNAETKFELQKFLIKRLWDYYKYGKKVFKE